LRLQIEIEIEIDIEIEIEIEIEFNSSHEIVKNDVATLQQIIIINTFKDESKNERRIGNTSSRKGKQWRWN
jgi:hypothetical protein